MKKKIYHAGRISGARLDDKLIFFSRASSEKMGLRDQQGTTQEVHLWRVKQEMT